MLKFESRVLNLFARDKTWQQRALAADVETRRKIFAIAPARVRSADVEPAAARKMRNYSNF